MFTALAAVAGGRVFPNIAPNNVQKPYVVAGSSFQILLDL